MVARFVAVLLAFLLTFFGTKLSSELNMPTLPAIGSLIVLSQNTSVITYLNQSGAVIGTDTLTNATQTIVWAGIKQLPTGEIVVVRGNNFPSQIDFYSSSFAYVSTASIGSVTFGPGSANSDTGFAAVANTTVTKFDAVGTVTGTVTLTVNRHTVALSPDNATVYSAHGGSIKHTIYKTVGGVESAFVARSPDIVARNCVIVLGNGTVISAWYDGSTGNLYYMGHDASGTQIFNVTASTDSNDAHTTIGRSGLSTHFWAVRYDNSISGNVIEKRSATTGALISSFTKGVGTFGDEDGINYSNVSLVEYTLPTPPGPTPPTTPPVVFVNSTPCCEDPDNPVKTWPGASPVPVGPGWTPSCAGGGAVPTAADVTLAEAWDF